MNNIFDNLAQHWRHDPANPAAIPPPPAPQPATTTITGGHVKLAALAHDTDNSFVALLGEVERLQASPIIQALEGVALTPAAEQAIAAIISAVAAPQQSTMASPQPEPAAPAAPAAEPAEHVA